MLESTRERGPAVELAKIREVERRIGVRFPKSYVDFLLAHNGGRPTPPNFFPRVNGRPVWMRIHFFFGIDHPAKTCDLNWNLDMFQSRMPRHVVPIASDEAGNRFCLDLRSAKASPIVMWDHEYEEAGPVAALKVHVAESFEEWLTQLTHDA